MMKTEVFISETPSGRKVAFEKEGQVLPSGFIKAKDWLNSETLHNGKFSQQMYNSNYVRKATNDEADDYFILKDHSLFALNASN